MSILTATTLISTHRAIWNYPGCWQQMYPHRNRSTWPKCWPSVKLMLYSLTLGHQMPLPGSIVGGGYVLWQASLTYQLTTCQADVRCLQWGYQGAWGLHMKNKDSLLQSTLDNSRWSIAHIRTSAQISETQVSTTLGHQMPLPWGIEGAYGGDGCGRVHLTKHHPDTQVDYMLCWPAVVPLFTTRCLYWD